MVLNTFFLSHSFIVLVKVGLGDYFKFFFFKLATSSITTESGISVYFLLIKMNFDKSGLCLPLPTIPPG